MTTSSKKKAQRKQRAQRTLKIIFWLGVLGLSAGYLAFNEYGLLTQLKLKRQIRHRERQIEVLKNQQRELQKAVQKLREDMSYIEKIAREKYKMTKEGERIFLIIIEEGGR